MRRKEKPITATELAECCVCEQRVVFDRTRGRRRRPERLHDMAAGVTVHAAFHRAAKRQVSAETLPMWKPIALLYRIQATIAAAVSSLVHIWSAWRG